ncbi:hypothetical protein [Streptomyces sp. NPDC091371]|uniref:hypothetical protein n=1 Tax=Streptomyces sp. NPDC091371 TaxID=3155303 RepID=UPI00343AC5C1
MAGKKDKGQQPGKGREEQRMSRPGQDPVHPETGGRGKSPEELRLRQDEMRRERDEMRDEEL